MSKDLTYYKKLLNFMAMWLYIADYRGEYEEMMDSQNRDWDGPELNDMLRENWKHLVEGLELEPWNDGQHYGDCTRIPVTCLRCVIDEYYERADIEIAKCFEETEDEQREGS
jgi:hypothetical protein